MTTNTKSFETFPFTGIALDPIHVGTGGTRLGRVDNTIVRDPVTRIPKIPGSSLSGVMRAYTAMAEGKYPACAGAGQPSGNGNVGHCSEADCRVCTIFGFARGAGSGGGFAGLAAFSDMHVLLFPVASQLGPQWITCPMVLRQTGRPDFADIMEIPNGEAMYCNAGKGAHDAINLGWLYLQVRHDWEPLNKIIEGMEELFIPQYIRSGTGVVSDKLFTHIVNSNLEVRTSVAIDPATGAAEDGKLYTYEALPRGTVLFWEVTCKNPKHFRFDKDKETVTALKSPQDIKDIICKSHDYLEHLGIGGMANRGMGRMRVLNKKENTGTNTLGREAL